MAIIRLRYPAKVVQRKYGKRQKKAARERCQLLIRRTRIRIHMIMSQTKANQYQLKLKKIIVQQKLKMS